MANNLANTLKEAREVFFSTVASTPTFFSRFTDPVVLPDGQSTYVEADIYGLTGLDPMSASPTPKDLVSSASSTAIAAFEEVVTVDKKELHDTPGILQKAGAELGRMAALSIDQAWIVALLSGAVTPHPEDGGPVYAATGGGPVFFYDEFDVTPPNSPAPPPFNVFSQQNSWQLALSASNLSTVLAARHGYRNKSGVPALVTSTPKLVTHGGLETTAIDLVTRQGEIYDGSGLQSGSFGSRINGAPEILPGVTMDDMDPWWLIWTTTTTSMDGKSVRRCPIVPVLRRSADLSFTEAPDSHRYFVKVYAEYSIHLSTWEGDIQYSVV